MRAVKLGSKIVQVKGVMPLIRGLTRETPTGRAVGGFVVWHNFFEDLEEDVQKDVRQNVILQSVGAERSVAYLKDSPISMYGWITVGIR